MYRCSRFLGVRLGGCYTMSCLNVDLLANEIPTETSWWAQLWMCLLWLAWYAKTANDCIVLHDSQLQFNAMGVYCEQSVACALNPLVRQYDSMAEASWAVNKEYWKQHARQGGPSEVCSIMKELFMEKLLSETILKCTQCCQQIRIHNVGFG